jgi:GNAT superfamily N-acetyltransferase
MIQTATLNDLPRLRELLARANDAPYELERVAEEKCFGAGVEGEPRVRVYGDFEGVAVTCGKYLRLLAVDRARRRDGIGSALLADTNATVAFAEAGNYFTPGAFDENTIAFLKNHGWRESAATWNLECRAGGPPAACRRATHADRTRILNFIEHEFGKIWRFEAAHAFDRNSPTLFIAEENGNLAGFAAHDVNNRGLGFFGPTGVARAMRGRGIGTQLLRASLGDLHSMGFTRVIIPWTDALDFYAKACGARPLHRFVTLVR